MVKKYQAYRKFRKKIESFGMKLSEEEGISNVHIDTNYTQFIFKIQCDFSMFQIYKGELKMRYNQLLQI